MKRDMAEPMGYLANLDTPSPLPAPDEAQQAGQLAAARRRRALPHLESDTPIAPQAVAEAAWDEACAWLETDLPRPWIGQLTKRARVVYARNPHFRRRLRRSGSVGRDWLWAFMPPRHRTTPASGCKPGRVRAGTSRRR